MSAQESREVWSTYAKQDGQGGKGITRKDYAQAQAKLKWMVAEGEITEQQMREKLGEMRLMIGKQGITREDYAQAKAKMTEMVAAGEVTQEKMAKVLGAMRKMIGNSAKRATRAAYAEAQVSMQQMVDAGKITQEQMDARLVEMRKMIGRGRGDARRGDAGRGGERANGGDGEGRSDECLALRRKLGAAVTNGEMTREEAGEVWRAEGCGS
jgi:polyhydroxyalkanoate synthesis regulator phasin